MRTTCLQCGKPLDDGACTQQDCILRSVDQDDAMIGEFRRQVIIERASEAAHDILFKLSDGGTEELDWFCMALAEKFLHSAKLSLTGTLLKRELEQHMKETSTQ